MLYLRGKTDGTFLVLVTNLEEVGGRILPLACSNFCCGKNEWSQEAAYCTGSPSQLRRFCFEAITFAASGLEYICMVGCVCVPISSSSDSGPSHPFTEITYKGNWKVHNVSVILPSRWCPQIPSEGNCANQKKVLLVLI